MTFTSAVDICYKSMQGQHTLLVEQSAHLDKLCDELKSMVQIEGPPDSKSVDRRWNVNCTERPSAFIFEWSFNGFGDDLDEMLEEDIITVVKIVDEILLYTFIKVKKIRAECDKNKSPAHHNQLSVLLHQICSMPLHDFFCIIKAQEERLLATRKKRTSWSWRTISRLLSNMFCGAQLKMRTWTGTKNLSPKVVTYLARTGSSLGID